VSGEVISRTKGRTDLDDSRESDCRDGPCKSRICTQYGSDKFNAIYAPSITEPFPFAVKLPSEVEPERKKLSSSKEIEDDAGKGYDEGSDSVKIGPSHERRGREEPRLTSAYISPFVKNSKCFH
jgi:hypothetical protein